MWFIGVALALLIGISLGMLGGGGSILTLPILKYVFGIETKQAIAMSLFVVGTTSLFGAISHARAGRVRYRTAAVFGAAGMIGGAIGGKLLPYVPELVLLYGFSLMMFATAVAMLRKKRASAPPPVVNELPVAKIFAEGILVGIVTGLVGAGGGFLVVPALTLLGGLSMEIAIGTSLVVIALKQYAAFAVQLGTMSIDWNTTLLVTGMAVVGSVLGGKLVGAVSPDKLRRAFGWFVVAMATYLFLKEAPDSVAQSATYQSLFVEHIAISASVMVLLFAALVTFVERRRGASGTSAPPATADVVAAAPTADTAA